MAAVPDLKVVPQRAGSGALLIRINARAGFSRMIEPYSNEVTGIMATNESSSMGEAVAIVPSALQRRWGWLLVLGIVQIIAGAIALTIPAAASLAAAIVAGAVMLVAGIFQGIHAFSVRGWKGVMLQMLGAVLYIVAGLIFLLFPVTGALSLTIIVGVLLIADGAVRYVLAYRLKPRDGWGWFLAAAIASTLVGILLLVGWPITGLWALGILLGVNLIFSGVGNCVLALTFRTRIARHPEAEALRHRHA